MKTYIHFIKDTQESVTISLDKINSIQRLADVIHITYEDDVVVVEADGGKGDKVYKSLIDNFLNAQKLKTLPCIISSDNSSFVKDIFAVSFDALQIGGIP